MHKNTTHRSAWYFDVLCGRDFSELNNPSRSTSSTSFSIYYSILKTDNPDESGQTLVFLHKSIIFLPHCFSTRFTFHQRRRFLPTQSTEYLVPDDPLHPEGNLLHPLFHL